MRRTSCRLPCDSILKLFFLFFFFQPSWYALSLSGEKKGTDVHSCWIRWTIVREGIKGWGNHKFTIYFWEGLGAISVRCCSSLRWRFSQPGLRLAAVLRQLGVEFCGLRRGLGWVGLDFSGCTGSWANITVQTQVIYLNLANVEYFYCNLMWINIWYKTTCFVSSFHEHLI